jgi:hypothetical protein
METVEEERGEGERMGERGDRERGWREREREKRGGGRTQSVNLTAIFNLAP